MKYIKLKNDKWFLLPISFKKISTFIRSIIIVFFLLTPKKDCKYDEEKKNNEIFFDRYYRFTQVFFYEKRSGFYITGNPFVDLSSESGINLRTTK